MGLFDKNDSELYQQMCNHDKAVVLKSMAPTETGVQKQFQYLYVQDSQYMLGQGSFGKVFVCFYEGNDKIVKLALKIITIPQHYEQIKTIQHIVSTSRQEILALIKFRQNKHIIKIQDIMRQKNIIYIMLEYCNQRDLVYYFNLLKTKNWISKQIHVRYFFSQILDAFKELHKHNFMHRDIKPSNILVNNGVLKIADFGLSRQIFEGQEWKSFAQHVGTMITAAPQIVFKQEYTNKCDIYSLGTILYWMIYGQFPFAKVPTRQDFKENKLQFPSQGEYFSVSKPMIKLMKQMLAYKQSQRIDWIPLLEHQMFQSHNFTQYDKKVKTYYENRKLKENRQTYGRNFVTHVLNDDEFLETAIPTSYYKFLREIEGEQKFNRWQIQERNSIRKNPGLYAHKKIKDQYKNQDIRLKFYRALLIELQALPEANKNHLNQLKLMKNLIMYSIQKYMIYLMNKIKDQLVFTTPPQIFQISYLREAQQDPLHRDFVETIIQKVRGSQFMTRFSSDQVQKIQKKCGQYKLNQDLSVLFDQVNEGNLMLFLGAVDQCIIQLVYFIKSDMNAKFQTSYKSELEALSHPTYRNKIILIHHLFMFSMQNQVFPYKYDSHFPYHNFLSNQQFKDNKKFKILSEKILELVKRFQ